MTVRRPAPEERVDPDETLYRRIPTNPAYFPNDGHPPTPLAFNPTAADTDGISLWRANRKTPVEAATPPGPPAEPPRQYHLARLRAGDLTAAGMRLRIDPEDDAHVTIPDLDHGRRRETPQQQWKVRMATQLCDVIDPATGAILWSPPRPTGPETAAAPSHQS